jgi:hypothetical protein
MPKADMTIGVPDSVEHLFKTNKLTLATVLDNFPFLQVSDTSGIIPPVLKSFEAFKNNWYNASFPDVPNYSTHTIHSVSKFDEEREQTSKSLEN